LLVSDKLGVPSIRKFYDPKLETFPAKRIAQEAFLAGNDLLYLSQFDLNDDWPSQLANMQDTIHFFREKYASDSTFQMRVDESVARILQRKLDMMGDFTLEDVQVPEEGISEIVGQQGPVMARAAQEATTLIYPGVDELTGRLPSPPLSEEQILIITDDRRGQECVGCVPFHFIDPLALQSLVLRLYGPAATGQISADQVHSMTFSELKGMLATEPQEAEEQGAPEPVEAEAEPAETEVPEEDVIDSADWIIFAMLDMDVANYPDSDALTLFLRERSNSLQGKKLIVLAFNAPYYLDSTEVSKLTAYYCLYGKTQPYLETAVRLLFQEFQPRGSSPVDVDAIGYQIIEVTRPDPNQVINIEVVTDTQSMAEATAPTATPQVPPEGTPIPIQLDLEVGDVLTLRTGMIVDRNGRQVPDGTPVEFRLLDTVQSLEARLPLANTVDGVATASFNLDRSGTWQITAASDTAQRSVRLILAIPEKGPVEIGFERPTPTATTIPTPSPTATNTPAATATSTPTYTPTPTPLPPTPTLTATPAPTTVPEPEPPGKTVNPLGLFLSVICLALVGVGTYRLSTSRSLSPSDRVERSLVAVASGLLGYVLFGSGLAPLERVPFMARAVDSWLPYEVLPVVVCLMFAGLGLWLAGIQKAGQVGVNGEPSEDHSQ
jgi:beta-N-acetylhexosaminidase